MIRLKAPPFMRSMWMFEALWPGERSSISWVALCRKDIKHSWSYSMVVVLEIVDDESSCMLLSSSLSASEESPTMIRLCWFASSRRLDEPTSVTSENCRV